jgi:hypothetical protein
MTYVLVVRGGGFKNCCMGSGHFDGAPRSYYRRG